MSPIVLAFMTGALVALPIAGTGHAQQPSRPPIATTKVEGTDNVYIFRNVNHQSMFIVTSDGVIATDPVAYGRPTGGQTYLDEIRKVTDKPVKYVIYSHHHFDHIAGGKTFKDAGATFIAHRRAKERLEQIRDPHTVLPSSSLPVATAGCGGVAPEARTGVTSGRSSTVHDKSVPGQLLPFMP